MFLNFNLDTSSHQSGESDICISTLAAPTYLSSRKCLEIQGWGVAANNLIFFFEGRFIFGPDVRSLVLTMFLIVVPVTIFCIFVARNLADDFSCTLGTSIMVVAVVFTFYVLVLLLLTSGRDPGIIPRNLHPPEPEGYDGSTDGGGQTPQLRLPRVKEVEVNGNVVKIKYCDTCMLYRPPRCPHCSICNNCVERFDHHCPWVGQCIGMVEELRVESQHSSESSGTIGRSKGASIASSHQQISVTVVTEFVRWNEEAVLRCTLFSSQVGIAGVPDDTVMKKTKALEDNWTAAWNEVFEFPLSVPELALLRIEVHEYDMSEKDDFGGQTCLPVSELRTGIRAVPLHSQEGEKYKSVKLLMRFEFV